MTRPPIPPFTAETAATRVRLSEDARNSRDPERVALACRPHSNWRDHEEFLVGREEIRAFLTCERAKENGYASINDVPVTETEPASFGPRGEAGR